MSKLSFLKKSKRSIEISLLTTKKESLSSDSISQENFVPWKKGGRKRRRKKKLNLQIRPDSTVSCLVASLCPSWGTWGLNTAHFICWTTWELGAQGITMRMPSVSRELTKPPSTPPPSSLGPLHWWTLTRKLKECLPLSDPKGSPATATTTATASPPSVLPTHHPVAATGIYSPSIPPLFCCISP